MLVALMVLVVARAEAHCDTLDGPVVADAKAALANADVSSVLKWVKAEDEAAIRAAFDKTLTVRAKGSDARELADMYFFETLVRIHRAGEGAPYTGLKPAGTDPGPVIRAADQALVLGNVDELARQVAAHAEAGVRERFARAIDTKQHADHNADAGRAFVAAYVDFVHYVERLHAAVSGQDGHHPEGAANAQSAPHKTGGCGEH